MRLEVLELKFNAQQIQELKDELNESANSRGSAKKINFSTYQAVVSHLTEIVASVESSTKQIL